MRRWLNRLPYLAALLTILLLWQAVAWTLPSFVFPGVIPTVRYLLKIVATPDFRSGFALSLFRLAVGYGTAVLAGTLLGLAAGLFRSFSVYLRGVISILQSIPPVTWVPMLAILLGFGNGPVIVVVAVASFFPMALSVMNATEAVNRTHLELARVLGASRRQLLSKVYGPETLPAVIGGAQVAFGNAWRSLIAGEMVGGTSAGLGWSISYAGQIANMKGVLSSILVIGCMAALVDRVVLEFAKQRLLRYRTAVAGGNPL